MVRFCIGEPVERAVLSTSVVIKVSVSFSDTKHLAQNKNFWRDLFFFLFGEMVHQNLFLVVVLNDTSDA